MLGPLACEAFDGLGLLDHVLFEARHDRSFDRAGDEQRLDRELPVHHLVCRIPLSLRSDRSRST